MVLTDISNKQSDESPGGKSAQKACRNSEHTADVQFYNLRLAVEAPPLVPDFREVFCSASPTKAWNCRLCKHKNVADVKDHLPKHQRRMDRGLNFLSLRYHSDKYSFVPYYATCCKQYSTPLNLFADRPTRTYEHLHHVLDNASTEPHFSWTGDTLELAALETHYQELSKKINNDSSDKSRDLQGVTEDFLESGPPNVDDEAGSSLGAEHSDDEFSETYQSQTTYTAILPNDEICYEISVERAEIVNFESDELGALESINQSTSLEEAGTEQMPLAQQSVQFAETTESMASFILGQSAAPKSELIDRELSPGKYDPEDMNVQHKVGFEKGTGSDDFLEANERNQYGNHFNGRTSPVKKTKLQNHDNAEQLNAPPSLAKDGAMLGNGTNKDIPSDATLQEHLEIEDPKNTTVVQNVLIESSDDDATLSEAASDSPDIKAVKKGEEMIKMEETRHNTASHANRTSRKRVLAMRKIILSSLSDIRFNCVHRNTDDDNWTCTLCNISSLSVFSVVEHCQGKKHTKSCDAMLPGMESNNENLKTVTAFSLGEPNRLSYADVVKKIQLITGSTKPNVSVFSQSRESLQSIRDVVDHVQAPEHKLSTWTLERQQNELINVASPAPVSEETIAEDLDEEEKSMLRQLLLMHTPSSCFEVLTKEANEIRTEESPMFPDTPFNSPIAQSNIHISPSFSYLLDASLGYIIEKEGSQKVNHDDTILGSVFQNENVAEFVQSEASLKQNTQENDILECQTARQCIAALAYFNLLTPKRSFGPLN